MSVAQKVETHYWRVPVKDLPSVWPNIETGIQDAMDRSGQYDAADVFELAEKGDWQIWLAWHGRPAIIDCIVITTIVQYPKSKECCLLAATGNVMENWTYHIREIEAWAKDLGCDRMRAISRPGWERVLTDYTKTHVELEKPL